MTAEDQIDVTGAIDDLVHGRNRDDAVERIHRKFFGKLVRFARSKLRDGPRSAADEEDVALSGFMSFIAHAEEGDFDKLDNRHDLRKLLFTITFRKALRHLERERARKRGGDQVVSDGPIEDAADPKAVAVVEEMMFKEMIGQMRDLIQELPDEGARQVAVLILEGHTEATMAAQLALSGRTIQRKRRLIHDFLRRELTR